MQQPISRPAAHARRKSHSKPVVKTQAEGTDLTWKVAAVVVGGYLTVVTIVGLAVLTVRAAGILFGAFNPQTGW